MKIESNDEIKKYASMGMAALLPGMEFALEILQSQVDLMRGNMAALLSPPRDKARYGWPDDPGERKKEMARRVAARAAKTKGEKISTAQKTAWAAMSPRQRKARLAAMAAGRGKKHLEAA